MSLRDRFDDPRPLLLDGPMGTELARRGVPIDQPGWSSGSLLTHPEMVARIHADYIAAGAEIITANTFRTQARHVERAGLKTTSRSLTSFAVALAREQARGRAWVAGSQAPLEDCYRPDLVPSQQELEREHHLMAEALADCSVDVILVETHNCIRETIVATQAALATGLPVLVSVVCGIDGRLLSGESVSDAARAIVPLKPLGVLVNCLPVEAVAGALSELLSSCGSLPVGAYANSGRQTSQGDWQSTHGGPAEYAAAAAGWLMQGVRIIGGCCGTTPAHISAIHGLLDAENVVESR